MPIAEVTALVVHRNRIDVIGDTVRRLIADPAVADVAVVDNASRPDQRRALLDALPSPSGTRIHVLDSGYNAGFGPGANVGLRWWLESRTTAVALVLPHDAVFEVGAATRLAAVLADHAEVGLVSADVGDGATPVVHPFLGSLPAPQRFAHGFEASDYAHGTMLALRRACVEQIGCFDERYFAYCEEADLGLRAQRAGWLAGVDRDTQVRNPGMGSPAALIDYLQLRNTLLLLRDHFGRGRAAFRFAVALLELADGTIRPGRRTPFFSSRARRAALVDVARGRYGVPPAWLFQTRDVTPSSLTREIPGFGAGDLGPDPNEIQGRDDEPERHHEHAEHDAGDPAGLRTFGQ